MILQKIRGCTEHREGVSELVLCHWQQYFIFPATFPEVEYKYILLLFNSDLPWFQHFEFLYHWWWNYLIWRGEGSEKAVDDLTSAKITTMPEIWLSKY
jgi:hypothetical protein